MVCTSLNRDCWYLYTLDPLGPKQLDLDTEEDPADQTIEILMQDLDPQVMALFNKVSAMGDPKQATQVTDQPICYYSKIVGFLVVKCKFDFEEKLVTELLSSKKRFSTISSRLMY